MELELRRTYFFDAAHVLRGLAPGHPCGNLHGHRFRVDVEVSGAADATGMVVDVRELDMRLAPLLACLDHGTLNNVEGLEQPTMENLAQWFARRVDASPARLTRIRVWESERSCVTWSADGK